MNTGHNPMHPLSDFTVTVKDYRKKRLEWFEWLATLGHYPVFFVDSEDFIKMVREREPADVEVYFDKSLHGDKEYTIVWAK